MPWLDFDISFDHKIDKFIDRTPNNEYNGLWIGLDFGKIERIAGVGYSPRNDRNNIMKNMDYELLVWNNGWVSYGRVHSADDEKLVFRNIPTGALMWLRNHTEGKEERIFQVKSDEQIWW